MWPWQGGCQLTANILLAAVIWGVLISASDPADLCSATVNASLIAPPTRTLAPLLSTSGLSLKQQTDPQPRCSAARGGRVHGPRGNASR